MSSSRPVQCCHPSCHRSFQSNCCMRQHYKDRHSRDPPQCKLPCKYCNRSFNTKGGLQDHCFMAHSGEPAPPSNYDPNEDILAPPPLFVDRLVEDVACNDCGKLFPSTDSLHQHQWDSANHTHVSKSPYPNHGSCTRECSQCGAKFGLADYLEQHYMDQHPISELDKSVEDGIWQHVAERFRSAWKKPTIKLYEVHRIFKVYNPGWRRWGFEEYRKELKKEMANQKVMKEVKLELRNRVLRDGNELRRYHGTTVKCQLGRPPKNPEKATEAETTSSLCADVDCSLCRILQAGFKKSKCKVNNFQRFGPGIYCSCISSKASAYVHCTASDAGSTNIKSPSFFSFILNLLGSSKTVEAGNYKVMMVCKVLAGRPFHSTRNLQQLKRPPDGFHSVQGDPGSALNYDELVVYDDRAILPEFIILYSSSD